jgi:hypothetical protein
MNPIIHSYVIDLLNKYNRITQYEIKQYDTDSHKFEFTLLNNSVAYNLTGLTGKIYIKKPNGNEVFSNLTIDNATGGKLSVLLTTQCLTVPGNVEAEITLYGTSGEVLTSITFTYIVKPVLRDDEAIESTNEYTALTEALAEVTGFTNLRAEVETARGGEATLNDRLDGIDSSLEETTLLLSSFPLQIPEIDDTARIQRAFDYADANSFSKIETGKMEEYTISNKLILKSSMILDLKFSKIKCNITGLDGWIRGEDLENFKIINGIFDSNLLGRSIIDLYRCKKFKIEFCIFTGYSNAGGHSATDSAIRISGCTGFILENLNFEDFGYQYDNSEENLNRCITIQAHSDGSTTIDSDFYTIDKSTFKRVNQAIVLATGKYATVSGNDFYEVKDNCVYSLGDIKSLIITKNHIHSGNDEGIVVLHGNVTISYNHFYDVPNRFIAIGASSEYTPGILQSLTVIGNQFINEIKNNAKVIAWRNYAWEVTKLIFTNNIVIMPNHETGSIPQTFEIGKCLEADFDSNDIDVNTEAFQNIFYFAGQCVGYVRNNKIKGSIETTLAVNVANVTGSIVIVDDNELTLCRISKTNDKMIVRNQLWGGSTYYYTMPRRNIVYGNSTSAIPSPVHRDTVINNNSSTDGIYAWQYNANLSSWEVIYTSLGIRQARNGTPIGNLTPRSDMDFAIDKLTQTLYWGYIQGDNTAWKQVSN